VKKKSFRNYCKNCSWKQHIRQCAALS